MIDLLRFFRPKNAVAPVVCGYGQFKGRRFSLKDEDETLSGWLMLEMGDDVKVIGKASPLEIDEAVRGKKTISGYPFSEYLYTFNSSHAQQMGLLDVEHVNFMEANAWDIAKAVLWEDNRLYYLGSDYRIEKGTLNLVRDVFTLDGKEGPTLTDIAGVTPELRSYYLAMVMQRQAYKELLWLEKKKIAQKKREALLEQFRKTFAGRLNDAVVKAGGILIGFEKQGQNRIMVEWKTGEQKVLTTITDDLRVVDAGFCLEGEDRKHSMNSLVVLSKIFQEEKPLYITRE